MAVIRGSQEKEGCLEMLNSDFYGGIAMIAFSALFWSQLEEFTPFGIMFPKVIIELLAILGIVMLVKSKFKPQYIESFVKEINKPMVGTMILSVMWVVLANYIGFFVISVASMWAIQWLLTAERNLKNSMISLAVSLISVCLIYFIFTKYLYIFFPKGLLF